MSVCVSVRCACFFFGLSFISKSRLWTPTTHPRVGTDMGILPYICLSVLLSVSISGGRGCGLRAGTYRECDKGGAGVARNSVLRTQRDGVGAGCWRAAGQVSWGRVGSVGRFDRLWYTDGRPFVRGAHQRHGAAREGIGQVLLECPRECNNEGGSLLRNFGETGTMSLIIELLGSLAHCRAHYSIISPSALFVEQ